jgi:transcriptional regulator with XRE-family HTH domain
MTKQKTDEEPVGAKLLRIRKARGQSREDVALAFNAAVASVRNWEKLLAEPSEEFAEKIRKYIWRHER